MNSIIECDLVKVNKARKEYWTELLIKKFDRLIPPQFSEQRIILFFYKADGLK